MDRPLKILIDMNLSPWWRTVFEAEGWEAVHWADIGEPGASDRQLMAWAADNGYLIFTHDLDFGAMLAATGAHGPSVVQVRAQDVLPDQLGPTVVKVICEQREALLAGALLIVDTQRARLRILPLQQ
jgi:predicted nuclease of predicted toxin-antitoxin system